MKKSENLGNLIGMSAEWVEENIDRGMWDILIELNGRGYITGGCCEGHPNDLSGAWHGYIYFIHPYKFASYPTNFTAFRDKRKTYEWKGIGEDSRQEFLNGLLIWAKMLPKRNMYEKKVYTLMGKTKGRANSREKVLINTYDFEDIKAILNRADMCKYDLRIVENVVERY